MSYKGKKNVYRCEHGHRTITVDLVEGVTPFMIRCRHEGCDTHAQSSFYRVDQGLEATHEWYLPSIDEAFQLNMQHPGMLDHVKQGGLVLRKIEEAAA